MMNLSLHQSVFCWGINCIGDEFVVVVCIFLCVSVVLHPSQQCSVM